LPVGIFGDEAFAFYEGLSADNSKTYWTEHKHVYEQSVRAPMTQLMEELAPVFGGDVFIFRPHRDVRFSKDKSPYKTLQTGFLEIDPGVGFFVQVDAAGLRVGGGFDARDRDQTARFRAAVDNPGSGTALAGLTGKLTKAGFTLGGKKVKTRPRGIDPDHPRLDLLRHEHIWASRLTDPELVTTALVRKDWQKLNPLLQWVRDNCPPG
jgi:uncharacterized protein (TIGR02453 family)